MPVPRLETLTTDPKLLLRAKLALKAVHDFNTNILFQWDPSYEDIRCQVAMTLSRRCDSNALNSEKKKFDDLEVLEFLEQHGFVRDLSPNGYHISREAADQRPRLYE